MNGYYNLVVAQLKLHGYSFLRPGKGSHEIWSNGTRNQTVSKNMPARPMFRPARISQSPGIPGCRVLCYIPFRQPPQEADPG